MVTAVVANPTNISGITSYSKAGRDGFSDFNDLMTCCGMTLQVK